MTDLERPPTPEPAAGPPVAPTAAADDQTPADQTPDDRTPADETNPLRLVALGGLVALLGIFGGWSMLVVVAAVVIMIFLHELGHYLAAKWSGMKVTEFFIGFGPKIWSFRRGETEYGFKAIPAGAYVKIIGMNNLDEVDPADEDLTYRSKSYPKRLLVAVAGSTMHFVQAIVVLFILFAFVGMPSGSDGPMTDWTVAMVGEDSAAADAGIREGDTIVAIDGDPVASFEDLAGTVQAIPGDDVTVTVDRDGQTLQLPATIGVDPESAGTAAPRGLLGVGPDPAASTVGVIDAAGSALHEFGSQSVLTVTFIADFFTPAGIADFAGDVAEGRDDRIVVPSDSANSSSRATDTPDENRIISIVGAVRIGSSLTQDGLLGFIVFFAGINITIGILNLLPVLPLDGGHVVVATYERIREFRLPRGQRHHVDFARLLPAVYAVFFLLMALGISAIYLDLIDPV